MNLLEIVSGRNMPVDKVSGGDEATISTVLDRIEHMYSELLSFKKDVNECKTENKNLVSSIKLLDENINKRFSNFEKDFKKVKKENLILKKENQQLKLELKHCKVNLNNLMNLHYSNRIKIKNVPFNDNENLFEKLKVISSAIGVEIEMNDIDYLLRAKKHLSNFNPSIIFKFLRVKKKNEFFKAYRVNKRKLWSELFDVPELSPQKIPIYIEEDMCKETYELFKKCKQLQKQGKLKYVWVRNGLIQVRKQEQADIINIREDQDLKLLIKDTDLAEDGASVISEGSETDCTDRSDLSSSKKRKITNIKARTIPAFFEQSTSSKEPKNY